MIREVQRIDSFLVDEGKFTAVFAGMEIPLQQLDVSRSEDAGRSRITVKYNNEVYVFRSYASDTDERKADEKRVEGAWKAYCAAVKKQEREEKKSVRMQKVQDARSQMDAARNNQLRIDKRHGMVHFAGKSVSALDVRMDIAEYGGRKRLTIEYENQLYGYEAPPSGSAFMKKLAGARLDKLYNDYCKARERALDG